MLLHRQSFSIISSWFSSPKPLESLRQICCGKSANITDFKMVASVYWIKTFKISVSDAEGHNLRSSWEKMFQKFYFCPYLNGDMMVCETTQCMILWPMYAKNFAFRLKLFPVMLLVHSAILEVLWWSACHWPTQIWKYGNVLYWLVSASYDTLCSWYEPPLKSFSDHDLTSEPTPWNWIQGPNAVQDLNHTFLLKPVDRRWGFYSLDALQSLKMGFSGRMKMWLSCMYFQIL